MKRQLSPQNINAVMAFSVVSPEIKQAIESVKYIAENMRSRNKAKEVSPYFVVTLQYDLSGNVSAVYVFYVLMKNKQRMSEFIDRRTEKTKKKK